MPSSPAATHASSAAEIEHMISAALPGAAVRIEDLRGDGLHYAITVIADAFEDKTRIQQHQMIHTALQGIIAAGQVALSIQTAAPDVPARAPARALR